MFFIIPKNAYGAYGGGEWPYKNNDEQFYFSFIAILFVLERLVSLLEREFQENKDINYCQRNFKNAKIIGNWNIYKWKECLFIKRKGHFLY